MKTPKELLAESEERRALNELDNARGARMRGNLGAAAGYAEHAAAAFRRAERLYEEDAAEERRAKR